MDWPTAFVFAVLIIGTFALIAYQDHVRGEVMKEAIRNGATEVKVR